MVVARAFADFEVHSVRILRDLQISGIQPVDTAPQAGSDRTRGAGDLEMATDIYEARVGPIGTLLDEWYLTDTMIREMAGAGMEMAVHCHRHLPLFSPVSGRAETV